MDLYENTWEHIAHIQNLRGHPYTFYQKMGFTIVGVIPDANGKGKASLATYFSRPKHGKIQ